MHTPVLQAAKAKPNYAPLDVGDEAAGDVEGRAFALRRPSSLLLCEHAYAESTRHKSVS